MLKKFLVAPIGLLCASISFVPVDAAPDGAKKITKLKLSVNDSGNPVSIGREEGSPPPPPRRHLSPLAALSESELQRLAELRAKFSDSISAKSIELKSLRRQIMLLMAKPAIDRAQILQLQSKVNAVNADIANSRLSFELDSLEQMPAEARERFRKHLLFDAAFGPDVLFFGGPPPPGQLGLPPTCVPLPGLGPPPPPFGPPPIGGPSGLRPDGDMGPLPGRGPRGV